MLVLKVPLSASLEDEKGMIWRGGSRHLNRGSAGEAEASLAHGRCGRFKYAREELSI